MLLKVKVMQALLDGLQIDAGKCPLLQHYILYMFSILLIFYIQKYILTEIFYYKAWTDANLAGAPAGCLENCLFGLGVLKFGS